MLWLLFIKTIFKMKKLSKMTLLHVEKMSDSEMKQILGGNSLATLSSDNCYEEYISTDPPYMHYDFDTQKLTSIPRICKKTIGCQCVMSTKF